QVFPPGTDVVYFNLSFGCPPVGGFATRGIGKAGPEPEICATNWPIRNLPVLRQGTNIMSTNFFRSTNSYYFPLTTNGVPLYFTNYGYRFSTNVVTNAPPTTNGATIRFIRTRQFSGFTNQPLRYYPPVNLIGTNVVFSDYLWFSNSVPVTNFGTFSSTAKPVFPNHEQGEKECAPISILNSLEYLNAVFQLGIGTNHLNTNSMKTATLWTTNGAPGNDPANPTWVQAKKDYMAQHNLPIATEVTTNAFLARAALRSCYDVELMVYGHVVCVVEMTLLTDGNWKMVLHDDQKQGKEGGTYRTTAIYYPEIGLVFGSTFTREFGAFIIERPGQ
ncbi:MAG TPA: hypothetical protein VJW76_05145, partial [Verrucomicrobiae bacterium]|nr:hypothetical protein [Verrucomicrobiae bacterium]